MLVNSVMQSLDERLVLGKSSTKSISLLNVLKKSFEYATTKYNNGEKEYFKVITQLNLKIQKLKYECPDICSFRDKFIFEKPEPPVPEPEPEPELEPEDIVFSVPSGTELAIGELLPLVIKVLWSDGSIEPYSNTDTSRDSNLDVTELGVIGLAEGVGYITARRYGIIRTLELKVLPDPEPEPIEPPRIEDNTIPLTTDSTPQVLPYEEVIKGIALNDVGSIQIVEKSPLIDLYVNDLPVQENYTYPAGTSFSAKLNDSFMFENFIERDVCKIARIDRNGLNQSIADGYTVVGLDPSGNVVLQTLTPSLSFKTLDSTIYNSVRENFKVKVTNTEDNNLWSNVAVIDLEFSPICKPNDCPNKNTEVVYKHSDVFVLSMDEIYGDTIDKIKIKNITFTDGILLFNGQNYTSDSNLEIVVTKEDLLNNLLVWRPTSKVVSKLFIEFTIPSTSIFKYCDVISTFELTKLENYG